MISFLSEILYSVYTVGGSMVRVSMVALALLSNYSFYSHSLFHFTMNYMCKSLGLVIRLHSTESAETQVVQQALRFCSLLWAGHLSKILMGFNIFFIEV